jgi:hypothetical protein
MGSRQVFVTDDSRAHAKHDGTPVRATFASALEPFGTIATSDMFYRRRAV